ncbi:hypothetical protein Tco_1146027 [Tanacetum coccineum]
MMICFDHLQGSRLLKDRPEVGISSTKVRYSCGPAKIESVKDWAFTKFATEIVNFGPAAYYRRFMKDSQRSQANTTLRGNEDFIVKLVTLQSKVGAKKLLCKGEKAQWYSLFNVWRHSLTGPKTGWALVMYYDLDLPKRIGGSGWRQAKQKTSRPKGRRYLIENSRDPEKPGRRNWNHGAGKCVKQTEVGLPATTLEWLGRTLTLIEFSYTIATRLVLKLPHSRPLMADVSVTCVFGDVGDARLTGQNLFMKTREMFQIKTEECKLLCDRQIARQFRWNSQRRNRDFHVEREDQFREKCRTLQKKPPLRRMLHLEPWERLSSWVEL